MSMLIFFTYIVGVLMKVFQNVNPVTSIVFIIGLIIQIISFCITSYGSYIVEQWINNSH